MRSERGRSRFVLRKRIQYHPISFPSNSLTRPLPLRHAQGRLFTDGRGIPFHRVTVTPMLNEGQGNFVAGAGGALGRSAALCQAGVIPILFGPNMPKQENHRSENSFASPHEIRGFY